MGDAASLEAMRITADLRANGICAQTDVVGRSLKAQMKYADKIGARYTMVLGDNEIAEGVAELRDMRGGERVKVGLSIEDIIDKIKA
jgi:histidyl-tRNA synthetase